jgi:predicted RNase H-like HicB family nuclease
MEWILKVSIWREGDWYVSHCEDLEIASQGRTIQEAQDNLGEAIQLFFEVASYPEIMGYLSHLDPVSPPEIKGQPEIRIKSTHQESQQTKCEFALAYA